MNLLCDINHPGHVHLFKNTINELKTNNNLHISVKDIISAKTLLEKYNLDYISLGEKKDSLFLKALLQVKYNYSLWKIIKKFDIKLAFGTSASIAHLSKISKLLSIVTDDDDDEVEPYFVKYVHPFCDCVLSTEALKGKRNKKDTIFYSGYHELAYLHPKRFTPDLNVLKESGLKVGDTFFILRFNVFKAHHDIGINGISLENKLQLVNFLKPYGKIFITTEREIEPELKEYQYKLSPEKIHSFLYYATMFIGDSQTMTSEAAVLGTPAIRSNSFVGRIAYLEEEEHKYGLTYGFLPEDFSNMYLKIKELLSNSDLKGEWKRRKENMLEDKIDVTSFFTWFIGNYPDSFKVMKKEPEYQKRFRG